MTAREHLAALVSASPPDALLSVPAQWLREVLDGPDSVPAESGPVDLTVGEFGARFGRSASTARAWCELGKVPGAWKFGREWRIPTASLQAFRQQQGAPAPDTARPTGGDLDDWRKRRAVR